MKVRVLGCSGAIARGSHTTAFLADGNLLVDAGTGVGELTLDEMRRIDDVLLTHAHLDHVAALPLMLDAVGAQRAAPVRVHAPAGAIEALRQHVFNDRIWPDFTRLPSPGAPFLEFHPLAPGQVLSLGRRRVEVLPAMHTVPAVGYALDTGGPCWVFSGDTGPNPALWRRLNQMHVAALVIETAFSDRDASLASRSGHLSPQALAGELRQMDLARPFPVYITHAKPCEVERIMAEVRAWSDAQAAYDIRWLHGGLEMEI